VAIDDPVSALQALNASDERQGSPILTSAEDAVRITKLFLPAGEAVTALLDTSISRLNRRRAENRNELLAVVVEEAKFRGAQIERLAIESEAHGRFIREEWPGLVVDAFRRAEDARTKDRVRRLGRILVHAAEVGPQDGADHAEEMMRIAMELNDRDIVLLRAAARADLDGPSRPTSDAKRIKRANEVWFEIPWASLRFLSDDVESVASKLQGLGLLAAATNMASQNSYMVLKRAHEFLDYIRSNTA
jgi:hypothetical protein